MSFKNLFTFRNSLFSTFTLNQAKRTVAYVAVLFQADEEVNEGEQRELDALGAAASAGIGVGVAPTHGCAVRDGSRRRLCAFPVGKGARAAFGAWRAFLRLLLRPSGSMSFPGTHLQPSRATATPQLSHPIPIPRGSGVSYNRPLPSFFP